MASILLCANTQYGTATKPISNLIKVLTFHLPAFCCAKLSSWNFVPRVGTLSIVLQSAYLIKLIKSNLKYFTELNI